jgi:copper chaperone CopZ
MERRIKLKAEDIICAGCAEDMQTVLKNTEGILDAHVDFSDGTVNIRYDPDVIDEKQVFIKVNKLGFKSRILSSES